MHVHATNMIGSCVLPHPQLHPETSLGPARLWPPCRHRRSSSHVEALGLDPRQRPRQAGHPRNRFTAVNQLLDVAGMIPKWDSGCTGLQGWRCPWWKRKPSVAWDLDGFVYHLWLVFTFADPWSFTTFANWWSRHMDFPWFSWRWFVQSNECQRSPGHPILLLGYPSGWGPNLWALLTDASCLGPRVHIWGWSPKIWTKIWCHLWPPQMITGLADWLINSSTGPSLDILWYFWGKSFWAALCLIWTCRRMSEPRMRKAAAGTQCGRLHSPSNNLGAARHVHGLHLIKYIKLTFDGLYGLCSSHASRIAPNHQRWFLNLLNPQEGEAFSVSTLRNLRCAHADSKRPGITSPVTWLLF